ncbi:MAG: hypothetical protein V3U20_08705 [Thermoplasmata archaeon]
MFPEHCREVSVKRVSFPLTKENIQNNLLNKTAYKRTEFIVLNSGDNWAVVSIRKRPGTELFGIIEKVEIISLPGSTKYLEDKSIDVLSPTRMAEKAEEVGAETLIVRGKFEHVSFIHKEKPVPIIVFDVTPPEPPKLVELVRSALYSGTVPKPVEIIPQILDLCELEKKGKNQNILFPCHASGLKSDRKTFYLDQRPEFSPEEVKSVSLIGCDLSLRIFKTLYDIEPEFFNFCPKKRAIDMQPEHFVITKCCELKEGHERIGNLVIVPWGSTQREVADALNELLMDKE